MPSGAVSGLAAARAHAGLTASDNAMLELLRDLERERAQASTAARSVVRALASTLQARDGYTGDHADAVQALSLDVGARLGLDRDALAELAAVALLHDVGKIGIPDAILHKPGPLNEDEQEIMRRHPVIGERILSAVPGLEQVARAVRHEHEHWDAGGYPDGLAGEEIPLASRIVLACDAWHALVSDRPYRAALGHDVALEEIRRCAGSQFDPAVVEKLLEAVSAPARGDVDAPDADAVLASTFPDSLERELVALISVGTAVSAAHRLDDVLEVAAEAALGAIEASSLSIERWVAASGVVRTLINVGELAPGEERRPEDEIYQLEGDDVMLTVIKERGTHFCSLDDPDLPDLERQLLLELGKHCSVSVPIMYGEAVWGQIWAARTKERPSFSARDARFLHAIAVQIGGAIGRAEVFSQVSELARRDGLTGLANRRGFDESLELAHLEARRDGYDLSLAMFDLDNLKDVNDHKGHEAGDAAIREAACALTDESMVIPGALVSRVGGDEFCVLMPNAAEAEGRALAHRVVRRLAEHDPPLGVSCGVAVLRGGRGRPADLLRAADAAQYAAKRAGRGRVFVSGLSGEDSVAHLLHDDARSHRRALRDFEGADVGRLLTETLAQLDRALSSAEPPERLSAVLRRCGEAIDASRWTLSFARTGARPRTVSVAGRPGALRGQIRRSSFLRWAEVESLRHTHGLTPDTPAVIVSADDERVDRDLRERLRRKGVTELLVGSISGAWGAWVYEIVADDRSSTPAQIEPVLRLLGPEALRSDGDGPAPLGLVKG